MKKFLAIAFIAAILIAVYFFIRPDTKIAVVSPNYEKAVQAVYATGTVEASVMVPISPKISARLMALEADEGFEVSQGDVLARLEDTDTRRTLDELRARLELAQKEAARSRKLAKGGALSKEALDTAEANLLTAQAAVARTEAELSYLQLVAPENGMIIRRDGEIGELMMAGEPVFWMQSGDAIRIETEVDEEDIALVKPGQKVLISADAFPERIFNGDVQSITPKGDPVARSYRVRVGIKEATPLMIGMTAETNIIVSEKERALMIPAGAVKGGEVWVKRGETFERVKITEGIDTGRMIEVTDGISETDQIARDYDDAAGVSAEDKGLVCNMGTGC